VRGNSGVDTVFMRKRTWDEENRLKSAVDPLNRVEYRYDYSGKRTNKKTIGGKETLYYNNMWVTTEDSPGFRQMKNIYLGKKRIATRLGLSEGNSENYMEVNTYYYHTDHLGSSSVITDWKGEVYEEYQYTPYGETWIEKGNDNLKKIPYRFNAKELDEETGNYYYGARYLNPRTSRWTSADPAGMSLINPMKNGKPKQGYSIIEAVNWYSYTSNNPVKYIDPTGKKFKHFATNYTMQDKNWAKNEITKSGGKFMKDEGCAVTTAATSIDSLVPEKVDPGTLGREESLFSKKGLDMGAAARKHGLNYKRYDKKGNNLTSVLQKLKSSGTEYAAAVEVNYKKGGGEDDDNHFVNVTDIKQIDGENYVKIHGSSDNDVPASRPRSTWKEIGGDMYVNMSDVLSVRAFWK